MRTRGIAWLFISLLFDSNLLTYRIGFHFSNNVRIFAEIFVTEMVIPWQ